MKKIIAFIMTILLGIVTFTGCSTETTSEPETPFKIAALKGPTAMGLVSMMENDDYEFTIAASADEITPLLVKGELDFAAVPANLASVLHNNTDGEIQVVAINTLGVLYIIENGSAISSINDLKGKTIYASGKGSTPEYALNYILSSNGIDPETDVTIEWKSEHTECLTALLTTDNGIAMLPQPFVTTAQTKNETIRIALDLTKEWDDIQQQTGGTSSLVTGVLVGRKEVIETYPEQVNALLNAYEVSVAYTNEHIEEAAQLIEKADIVPAAVAQQAIPYCNITLLRDDALKETLSGYLSVLYEQNPAAVGGTLPDDTFYYKQ